VLAGEGASKREGKTQRARRYRSLDKRRSKRRTGNEWQAGFCCCCVYNQPMAAGCVM